MKQPNARAKTDLRALSSRDAVRYVALTRERAQRDGAAIVALGADNDWESWTTKNLLAEKPGKWHFSELALLDETPIAYAVASRRETSVHLHHLIVGKKWRSAGIGGRFLCHLALLAQRDSIEFLTLKVYGDNQRAIAFYETYGLAIATRTLCSTRIGAELLEMTAVAAKVSQMCDERERNEQEAVVRHAI